MCALAAEEIRASFRQLDPARHPLLSRLTRDEIYDGGTWMAPGGLMLANQMAEHLALKNGSRVLDIGCGRGQSSVFLASRYRSYVVSLDLWVSAEDRERTAAAAGVEHRITPIQGDIRRGLPVALTHCDGIFCMQAFHCFGTRRALLPYLASLLNPGGKICIAQGCFREEVEVLPPPFTETDSWNAEYHTYHSPGWWREHFASSGAFDVDLCQEVMDGDILWEDDVLYRGDRARWSAEYLARSAWLIRQILHGRTSRPSLTHCLLVATKRKKVDLTGGSVRQTGETDGR